MYRFLLTAFFLLALFSPEYYGLCAQSTELSISPATVSKEIIVNALDKDFEDISTIRLTNTGNNTLQLQWSKEIESGPSQWQSTVLDKRPNYSPFLNNAESNSRSQASFKLKPGASVDFFLVLRPNDRAGKGRISVNFTDITKPNLVYASSVFDLKVVDRKSTASPPPPSNSKNLQLYPNPAIDNFFVQLPRNIKAGKVEIFNTLGRKLKSYPLPDPEKGYDISDLPEGIYLINIFDDQGKKLRTLRLFHRRFGGA